MGRMGISEPRDLEVVREGLSRWVRSWRPEASDVRIAPLVRPATGLSSETIFAEVDWTLGSGRAARSEHASWVLRLPPDGEGLFPSYDVAMQGRLQAVVAGAGVPAVVPLAVEEDDGWMGAPFLLMPRVPGRVVRADKPYLRTGWLAEASPEGQRRLHDETVGALAQIHRLDWRSLGADSIVAGRSRGDGGDAGGTGWLAGELEHWAGYLAWAGEGNAPGVFDAGVEWCRAHMPSPEPPASLLWGDVQLGNVLVGDALQVVAVLDFEMATIGPAEVDLAWFVVLHDMAVDRCGGDLPGFPGRAATIATYEAHLGRTLTDLRWYEAFAVLRSGAILVRAARLLARLGVDDSWLTHQNPTIDRLAGLISP
jgi:aminoglycoside phosphotransferase (APT) family kinase protein